ncbi:MAG: 50S ribosomal protein L37ae [Candidatus Aenigmarchaeota archaeon]|nr:50S ribosomal protein L37ae [Candidatus Aenigmarchaeota archaeon]
MATKKVGITGKYGPRYGRVIREKVAKVTKKKKHSCPHCKRPSLKREAAGIWLCKKCGLKIAGKAYKP